MVVSYMDFFFYLCLYDEDFYFFFFFQAEDGIRDGHVTWSSDVCSSDLVQRESDRIERARDQGCARPGCLERGSKRRTAGALAMEADGKTARLPQALDELP